MASVQIFRYSSMNILKQGSDNQCVFNRKNYSYRLTCLSRPVVRKPDLHNTVKFGGHSQVARRHRDDLPCYKGCRNYGPNIFEQIQEIVQ